MLTWDALEEAAPWLIQRYRAVIGNHEYRIFYGPGEASSPGLPWILILRTVGADGVYTYRRTADFQTGDDAMRAAERWHGEASQ